MILQQEKKRDDRTKHRASGVVMSKLVVLVVAEISTAMEIP
jgi:hypothetical protein